MSINLKVSTAGAALKFVAPANAQPGELYFLHLKGGKQGPIVTARQSGADIQVGPLPENITVADIEKLALLPPIERLEIEGGITEQRPSAQRVIELISEHGDARTIILHV